MRTAVIQTHNLCKTYSPPGEETAWAVHGIELSIFRGEVTVLMGPSGSGKTTLLSLMGCILAPTRGTLSICGQSTHGFSEDDRQAFRRSHLGFIFQSYNLFASLTARQNIELALALRGTRESAIELLDAVGLTEKADRHPAQLSGGERQRVAVARALAGDPPVLLADEPTAALDAANGRRVMKLLHQRAHESGTAVVVVTHDQRVLDHADRVVELEDGIIRRIFRYERRRILRTAARRHVTSPV